MIIQALTVILTLKIANQSFCMVLQFMIMCHHTKLDYKRLSASEDFVQTKPQQTDKTHTQLDRQTSDLHNNPTSLWNREGWRSGWRASNTHQRSIITHSKVMGRLWTHDRRSSQNVLWGKNPIKKNKQKNPGEKQDSQFTTTPKLYKTQLLKYTTVLYPNQLWQVQ